MNKFRNQLNAYLKAAGFAVLMAALSVLAGVAFTNSSYQASQNSLRVEIEQMKQFETNVGLTLKKNESVNPEKLKELRQRVEVKQARILAQQRRHYTNLAFQGLLVGGCTFLVLSLAEIVRTLRNPKSGKTRPRVLFNQSNSGTSGETH